MKLNRSCFMAQHLFDKMYKQGFHRNDEIDFVLKYIPDLSYLKTRVPGEYYGNVLDVGCTESLLIYEIESRGFLPIGVDIRPYHTDLPKYSVFFQKDITSKETILLLKQYKIDYVVALSSVEHIGLDTYDGKIMPDGDRLALENINKVLDDDGLFVITVPTKLWQTDSGRGYTPREFKKLISGLFDIYEITQGGGQICACLIKSDGTYLKP